MSCLVFLVVASPEVNWRLVIVTPLAAVQQCDRKSRLDS